MKEIFSYQFITLFFTALILICWLIIMIINFRKRSEFNIKVDLADDEQELDKIDLGGSLNRESTVLTTRRLFQFQKRWWLSSTLTKFLQLDNINSINLLHTMNLLLFFVGLVLYPLCAPLGYAIFLYAFVSQILILEFKGETAKIKVEIKGTSLDSSPIIRFLNSVQRQIYTVKEHFATVGTTPLDVIKSEVVNFRLTLQAVVGIALFGLLALLQRLTEKSIYFDDYFFFPLYLAIPAIIGAKWSAKDGFIAGFFGFWALFTIMYPFPQIGMLADAQIDSPFYISAHYLIASLILGFIGLSANAISQKAKLLSPLALILWLIFICIFQVSNLYDLSMYAQLLIGMLWILVIRGIILK